MLKRLLILKGSFLLAVTFLYGCATISNFTKPKAAALSNDSSFNKLINSSSECKPAILMIASIYHSLQSASAISGLSPFAPDASHSARATLSPFFLSISRLIKSSMTIKEATEFLSSDEIAQVLNKTLRSPYKGGGKSTGTTTSYQTNIPKWAEGAHRRLIGEAESLAYDPELGEFAALGQVGWRSGGGWLFGRNRRTAQQQNGQSKNIVTRGISSLHGVST